MPNAIIISEKWSQTDNATHMEWVSDDGQGWMDGGPLDQSISYLRQAEEWADEMLRQGHDGTGTIRLCRR